MLQECGLQDVAQQHSLLRARGILCGRARGYVVFRDFVRVAVMVVDDAEQLIVVRLESNGSRMSSSSEG